jgi:hypothetical protein
MPSRVVRLQKIETTKTPLTYNRLRRTCFFGVKRSKMSRPQRAQLIYFLRIVYPYKVSRSGKTWELTKMKKFLVTYLAPASVIAEWKKTDPDMRKAAEGKMQAEWKRWMNDHANMFADIGAGVGKTKVVTGQGVSDGRNDIMLYSVVEAESHEAAAKSFDGHPHLQIPQSSIEIMEVHALPAMK